MNTVGVPLLESIYEYGEGNYKTAVNLLYPVRYHITKLGGSDAQVFHQNPLMFTIFLQIFDGQMSNFVGSLETCFGRGF